jgi:hypothetical protein
VAAKPPRFKGPAHLRDRNPRSGIPVLRTTPARTAGARATLVPKMLGTLRFRLTGLFLVVVLVFGLVSIALAVRLFQDVTRSQSVRELRR